MKFTFYLKLGFGFWHICFELRMPVREITRSDVRQCQSWFAREENAEKTTEKLSGTAEKHPDGGLCS